MAKSKRFGKSKGAEGSINYPLPFLEGLRLYWQGRYWHSHEEWEQLWREREGAEKHFLQGLIQIDAALIHTDRGDWGGVANLLRRSLAHLSHCPDRIMGMDVANLRKQLEQCLAEAEALKAGRKQKFNWHLKPVLTIDGVTPPKRQRYRRAKDDQPIRRPKSDAINQMTDTRC